MRKRTWCAVLSAFLLLAGCGGSDAPSSQQLAGTVSAGSQVSGSVLIMDSAGTAIGPIAITPEGTFSADVAHLAPPFLLKATGYANARALTLFSAAPGAGRVNINPVTDAAVHMVSGVSSDAQLWAGPAGWRAGTNEQALANAAGALKKLLLPFFAAHDAESAQPFSDPVRLGAGFDAVFDRVSLTVDEDTGVLTVTSRVNGAVLASLPLAQVVSSAPISLANHPAPRAAQPVKIGWYAPIGADLGSGLDAISMNLAGTCVTGTMKKSTFSSSSTEYALRVVEDAAQISDQLSLAATAQVRVGLYSGSAAASYARDMAKDTTSVYVLASAVVRGAAYDLTDEALTPASKLYDVAAFHNHCGDRYLKTIGLGGKFIGIVRINTASESDKQAIKATIKAKYSGPINNYSGKGSFSELMTSLSTHYEVSINAFWMGATPTTLPTDYDSFMKSVQDFPASVAKCLNGTDDKQCAYEAVFNDYANIPATGDLYDISVQQQKMNALVGYELQYEALEQQISDILARPDAYVPPIDTATLKTWLKQVKASSGKILAAATFCADNSAKCTSLPAGMIDPDTITLPDPKEITPQSCADVKANFPEAQLDAEYRVFFGGDKQKGYYLYCSGMATGTPADYLTLKLVSPVSKQPTYNFASRLGDGDDVWNVFSKIRVQVGPSDLAVIRDDMTFAQTLRQKQGGTAEVPWYGQAYTNVIHSDLRDEWQGHANIDLNLTPFAIADGVQWAWSGNASKAEYTNWIDPNLCATEHRPNCGGKFAVLTPDRKAVSLAVAGVDGLVKPTADLRLKWTGQ